MRLSLGPFSPTIRYLTIVGRRMMPLELVSRWRRALWWQPFDPIGVARRVGDGRVIINSIKASVKPRLFIISCVLIFNL